VAGAGITAAALAIGIASPSSGRADIAGRKTEPAPASVSLDPTVVVEGGTPEHRQIVTAAVDRYVSVGLALPDLTVRIHDGNPGCEGLQGVFHAAGSGGVIDLCYPGEFLALHELGHAWEHSNLDDDDRRRFLELTGSTTWRSAGVVWRKRGCELAANALAHGLLSAPLDSPQFRERELTMFTALTGITSPRLSGPHPTTSVPTSRTLTADQIERLAAYEKWRSRSSTG
jgi:hypothetical protein